MKGFMAKGSERSSPGLPSAAAVVWESMVAPMYTPCSQLRACATRGTVVARRPPMRKASMGTPAGSSQLEAMIGHWLAGAVKRELGCAAAPMPASGRQSRRSHEVARSGASLVMPSHQMSPSSVSATLVKMQLACRESMALGLVLAEVPGATPKKPDSGLVAQRRPSGPGRSQAMSSPTHSTFQPGRSGESMARLVLPQADGKQPAMCLTSPSGLVRRRMSMCSAIQPSLRACTLAMRRAWHFLPRMAFPP
mmetsp:Transcript_18888/g.72007  ORF Transcript_18888/g.72007 Transcript_18888/m.72007 type:complete len:251 (+) Transcript_18888:957-1709(+)